MTNGLPSRLPGTAALPTSGEPKGFPQFSQPWERTVKNCSLATVELIFLPTNAFGVALPGAVGLFDHYGIVWCLII